MQLQNKIYILKKQFVNEKNFNALINFLKNFIEFFSSETTFASNDINIIIKLKRFIKHVDFKVFTNDFEKKNKSIEFKVRRIINESH